VASIKPSDPSNPDSFMRMDPGGRNWAQGLSVETSLQSAYSSPEFASRSEMFASGPK
jgi:hypothetical protein